MKKPRIYLDTSIPNFLLADDAPEFQKVTQEFFAGYTQRYDAFISSVVFLEIERTEDIERRERLLSIVREYPMEILPTTSDDAVLALVDRYLERGAIPKKKIEDAQHVAYATVFEMDILVSWNFRHLANVNREAKIVAINIEEGYRHPLRLLSPLGLYYE